MSEQIFAGGKLPRVPEGVEGVQVNYCHNQNCKNFGIPATNQRTDPNYSISGTAKHEAGLKCKACGRITTIKSNDAIHQELVRLSAPRYLQRAVRHRGYSCPNADCSQYLMRVTEYPSLYRKRGKTSTGNQKWQCNSCRRMFTVGSTKYREKVINLAASHEMIMKHIVNFAPLNRLCEVGDTDMKSLYRKIDLIFEKCALFSLDRESRLPSIAFDSLKLATDRQEYIVNWTNRRDKRTTQISAIASSDMASGYAFGLDVNFDENVDMYDVLNSPEYKSDIALELKKYHRHHARIWTPDETLNVSSGQKSNKGISDPVLRELHTILSSSIGDRSLLEFLKDNKLPIRGALVHSEFTQYAHFLKLEHLLGHAGKIVFYTDLESGIDNAINLAFHDKLKDDTAYHIFVKYDKTLTNDEREALASKSRHRVRAIQKAKGWTREPAESSLVSASLLKPIKFNGMKGQWYKHPIDRESEANKYISFTKEIPSSEWALKVSLMHQASTFAVDGLFQQIRRRITLLERPISSASENRRIWSGRSPYNPEIVNKVLQIFRVYYNYCLAPQGKKTTPAQRIGLAKGKVRVRDIIG